MLLRLTVGTTLWRALQGLAEALRQEAEAKGGALQELQRRVGRLEAEAKAREGEVRAQTAAGCCCRNLPWPCTHPSILLQVH